MNATKTEEPFLEPNAKRFFAMSALKYCTMLIPFRFDFQYLGCVEVFESRGMQVCEEAIKVLKVSPSIIINNLPVSELNLLTGRSGRLIPIAFDDNTVETGYNVAHCPGVK